MKQVIRKQKPHIIKIIEDNDVIPNGYTDNLNYLGLIRKQWSESENNWVEGATQEEIDAFSKQKQLEQITALNQKWKDDGMSYYNDVKNQITFSLIGKPNAMAIMSEINKTVYPLLNKIKEGDWPLAVIDFMDGKNNPTIQEVIDLFNQVGQKAIEYYQNKYPH